MARTLKQRLRPLLPNVSLRIPHLEPETVLAVRLGQHLGLVTRGTKAYEPRYVSLLRSLIKTGDRVFDIGANIGFYSVLFSRWVGREGSVFAYEPDSDNLKLLARNFKLNNCDNGVIREIALGNKAGQDVFSRDSVTGATGHLGAGPTYAETIFGNSREVLVEVEVNTLDQEVERWGPPDLMKLDVEGREFDVFSGGRRLLSDSRPLLIFESSSWEHSGKHNRASLATSLLNDHDYSVWNIDSGERVPAGGVGLMLLGIPSERLTECPIKEALGKLETLSLIGLVN